MEILIPKNILLRVKDKFSARFIHRDKAVGSNATLLYKELYEASTDTGTCRLPQSYLSEECKFSVRCLQNALRCLSKMGYIYVESDPGGCSTYVLLYSDHVKSVLRQYGYAVLEDSTWYPRDVQSSSSKSLPAASNVTVNDVPDSAPQETIPPQTIPPQNVQGGYANSAHPSYNVYKNIKNNTPPTPQPSQLEVGGASSATGERGGFIAPSAKSAALHQAFERLWAVWPITQARHGAQRVFNALARAGRLPTLEVLLETVEQLRTHDDRWKRGYVPHLVNWLRGERWADAPVTREGHTASSSQLSSPRAAQASALSSAARMDSMQENTQSPLPPLPSLPELPPALDADVNTLCSLWPNASRSPVRAFFRAMLAKGATPDMGAVLGAARQHLAESLTPRPLFCWLRQELRGCAA